MKIDVGDAVSYDRQGWPVVESMAGTTLVLPQRLDPQTAGIAEALAFKIRGTGKVFEPRKSWWRRLVG